MSASSRPVPAEYRSNFIHLYFDIAWFGVVAASTLAFTSVYATRLGANAFHLGLLTAGPAIVNLPFTLPAGRWLEKQPIDTAVFWAAAFNRFFYVLWLPLPWLLGPLGQVWAILGFTLLMSLPGTFLAVGFNALFAEAVPLEWRGHVAGVRNAVLSVTFIAVSLLCGLILDRVPFPTGYQVVFAIGFLGAAMSTLHLWFLTPQSRSRPRPRLGRSLGELIWPGTLRRAVGGLRPGVGLRFLPRGRTPRSLARDILNRPYARLIAVIFAFYLALYLAIPLFPIRWVNQLGLTDQEIGWGTAVFYVAVFAGSTQLARLTQRLGNRRLSTIGAAFMAAYPAFMAVARGLELYLVGSVAGGLGWSLVGGALTNYVLEKAPEDHRPAYLAWYNLALNGALLLGSLIGPLIAGVVGVPIALGLFALARLVTGLAIWRVESGSARPGQEIVPSHEEETV